MKFHKVKMIGKYWMQDIPTLPSWTADDEGRLVYQNSDETVYYGTSTGWAAVGSGGGGSELNIDRQEFTASAGQTVFNLSFDYTLGSNGLMVYADNLLQIKNVDYTETDTNTITFISSRAQDEEITVINVSTNASIQRIDVTSTAAQTVFNLPFSYVVGSNDLLVFSNNVMMLKGGIDYTETDSTTVTFAEGRAVGEVVTFLQLGISGEINTGANIGSTGELTYAGKSGTVLQFRKMSSRNGLATSIVSDTIMTEPDFVPLTTFPGTPSSSDYFIMRRSSDGLYYKVPGSAIGGGGGGGSDMSYIQIASTTDNGGNLSFSQTGTGDNTYTYTLANFSGIGLVDTEIREIFIEYYVKEDLAGSDTAKIEVSYPDGSTIDFAELSGGTQDEAGVRGVGVIPINPSQTDFTIRLITDAAARADFTIIGEWQRISASVQFFAPIGTILPFSGPEIQVPGNALLCQGQVVSRTTYSELFAVIGTTYGIGDGVTTFNVPDLRGRAILGKDDMGGTDAGRIDSTITPNRSSDSWAEDLGGSAGEDLATSTGEAGTSSVAGGDAYNNIQPSMAMNWIIIAKLDPQMPVGQNVSNGWAHFGYSGGVLTVYDSYNVSSIVRISAGVYQVNWLIPFASSSYVTTATTDDAIALVNTKLAGSVYVTNKNNSFVEVDADELNIIAFGDQ